MSTTKEIKTLLAELRQQLDEESRAKVEPILRAVLDAAKPKTITEVVYRGDPGDQAEIEMLRRVIAAKDEIVRELRARLPAPAPPLDHLSFADLIQQLDDDGRTWCECLAACMQVTSRNNAFRHQRKIFLDRGLRATRVWLGNYLTHLEPLNLVDARKLSVLLDENCLRLLNQIADEINTAFGIRVDLDMPLLDSTVQNKMSLAQDVVVIGGGAGGSGGAPRAEHAAKRREKRPPPRRRRH